MAVKYYVHGIKGNALLQDCLRLGSLKQIAGASNPAPISLPPPRPHLHLLS